MKKKMLLVIMLIMSLFFSGCWDYMEFENMAMTTAMGIDFDKVTKKITVSVEIISSGKDGGQKQGGGSGQAGEKSKSSGGAIVLSASDVDISGAIEKIQQGIGKSLFFGYQQIIVINEDAARNIMLDIIGFLDRTPLIRSTAYLIITSQKCEDVISTIDPAVSGLPSKNIYNLVKISGDSGNSSAISIKDFAQAMAVGGVEPVAPQLVVEGSGSSEEKDASQSESGSSKQPVKFVEPKEGHHTVEGIAAFQGEKFTGWLDSKESMGWALITGKNLKTYVRIEPSEKASSKEIIDLRIVKSKSSIRPKLEDNKVTIQVDVDVKASMTKSKRDLDLLTPDVISMIEEQLSDSVKDDIEASLKKAQLELKTDIFGFGSSFYRKYPRLWHSKYEREWKELFPDISVTVNVKAKVINTGTTIRSFIAK